MTRTVEVITAECPICEETLRQVTEAACPSCEVTTVSTRIPEGLARARELGVVRLPAVAIDGVLADCCKERAPDLDALRRMGLGRTDR